MTEWARLVRAFKRAAIAHYLVACGSSDGAARRLGMNPSNFRMTRKRLRHQPPIRRGLVP